MKAQGQTIKYKSMTVREQNVIDLLLADESELENGTYWATAAIIKDKNGKLCDYYEAVYHGGTIEGANLPCKKWKNAEGHYIKLGHWKTIRGKRLENRPAQLSNGTISDNMPYVFDNAEYREKRDISARFHYDYIALNSEYAGCGNGYYYAVNPKRPTKKLLLEID